jgi:hypothetical protein
LAWAALAPHQEAERRDPRAQGAIRKTRAQQLERLGLAGRRVQHYLFGHGGRVGDRREHAVIGAENLAHAHDPCGIESQFGARLSQSAARPLTIG